jgi:Leucine-rich repeat (LRR) protein
MTDYSVTQLVLSNKELTELPNDIHLYTKLKILVCSHNKLTFLPDNLLILSKNYIVWKIN